VWTVESPCDLIGRFQCRATRGIWVMGRGVSGVSGDETEARTRNGSGNVVFAGDSAYIYRPNLGEVKWDGTSGRLLVFYLKQEPRSVFLPSGVPPVTEAEIEDKVIGIVSEQMGVDRAQITRATSFVNDLNADSLDTVELVMELEDEFETSIPDEDAEKIQTVGEAVEFILKATAGGE